MASLYWDGKIHQNTLTRGTEKAFFVEISNGYWGSGHKNPVVWIPRRLCVVSKPNDVGWCDIRVPMWLFTNNRHEPERCTDITYGHRVYE